MKILLITARFYPEPFSISNIAFELQKMGHDITVLTGVPNSGLWKIYEGYKDVCYEIYNGIKIIRVNEKIKNKGFLGLIRNYLSILFQYRKKLKVMNGGYDIVFSHVMSPIFTIDYVGKYCKKYNIPHFHYSFDLWPESLIATGYLKEKSLFFKILKQYCKKKYERCDLISYSSPSAKNYFKDYLKIDTKYEHIYQPCLTKMPELSLISNHKYKNNGKIRILFCGTIARFNHLDLFIDSLVPFKEEIIFDVVGSGSELDNLKLKVKQNKLDNCVNFYGRIPSQETIKYYTKADVLFVPLFWNSATSNLIPQKLIEYFMYGRPIFGMIKGDGEVLLKKASENNIISDQTVEELQRKIKLLLMMKELDLIKCGEENRKFFEETNDFSIKTICKKIDYNLNLLIKK